MMRIACISDVCTGYGSPQVQLLVRSLAAYYNGEGFIVEPNRPELPPRTIPGLHIRRARNLYPPYTGPGRIEYLIDAARIIDEYDPDFLVVACTYSLPALFRLRKRPAYVLYHCYESVRYYGGFDIEMNRHLKGKVDLITFPEENRAAIEIRRLGLQDIPIAILFNCPDASGAALLPKQARNGRILYAGTIDRDATLADYYTHPKCVFPVDLYGPIRPGGQDEKKFLKRLNRAVDYRGYIDQEVLRALRKEYAYSIVMWRPSNENQRFAAPNKFFESIADGVPPIAAPHPQCKMLVQRYGCGLVMPDWSFDGFCATLERALRLYRSERWDEMAAGCGRAVKQELSWERQFEKLKHHLRN